MKRSTAGEGQRRLMEGLPPLCCGVMRCAPQRRFCFVDWDVAWSVAEWGVIQEECSEKLGFGVYRAVISILRLRAQEQLKTHPAYSVNLPECREWCYQLRFRLRSRHRPCCAFNARDECVCSARLSWVPTSSTHSRARSQPGDTVEAREHNSRSDGQAKIRTQQ